ncbi:MAG: hypothetical protein KAX31_07500 [Thermoplasmata archaeon]|nr:hypothetical protein [Thermoplasmata archaeon]
MIIPIIVLIGIYYKIWLMTSAYDWHQEQDQKQRRLLRPVPPTEEGLEWAQSQGGYIFVGDEIHLAEAHFPTQNPEYPTAFKVSWKIDEIIREIKEFVYQSLRRKKNAE